VTQARHILSSDETDWSSEQLREIETLVTDVEQLRDVVCSIAVVICSLLISQED